MSSEANIITIAKHNNNQQHRYVSITCEDNYTDRTTNTHIVNLLLAEQNKSKYKKG